MKIRLVMLGKTRREEIRALFDDYVKRIGRYAEIAVTEIREASPAALRKLKMEPGATLVLLDAGGNQFTHHAPRIRPRRARRANLPRLRHSRRPSISEVNGVHWLDVSSRCGHYEKLSSRGGGECRKAKGC
jgi:hypothetical protein